MVDRCAELEPDHFEDFRFEDFRFEDFHFEDFHFEDFQASDRLERTPLSVDKSSTDTPQLPVTPTLFCLVSFRPPWLERD